MVLMYKKKPLAVENGNGDFILFCGIDLSQYPPMNLWFNGNILSNARFQQFLEDRFPPPSRETSHIMCEKLGIAYPNHITFIELTRACTPMDDFWVALYPEDTYEQFSIRL